MSTVLPPSLPFPSRPPTRVERRSSIGPEVIPTFSENTLPQNRPLSLQSTACAREDRCLFSDWPRILQTSIGSRNFLLGTAIHAFLVKSGLQKDVFPGNNLVNMYSKFRDLDSARHVFEEMPGKNTITWTTLLNGYHQMGDFENAFKVACEMHRSGEAFSSYTCSSLIQVCGSPGGRKIGQPIHCLVVKSGLEKDLYVGTSLVCMYSRDARDGAMRDAEVVFSAMGNADVRCFNSMISGYGRLGDTENAIRMFCNLQDSGLTPNDFTFSNTLSRTPYIATGKQLHGLAVKYGCLDEVSVGNAVITMYWRHGLVEEAETMFLSMREKNVVSCTAILSVYVKNGLIEKARAVFLEMLNSGVQLDSNCMATMVDGCSKSKNLGFLIQVYPLVIKLGYLSDKYVGTALVDGFARCKDTKSARHIFNHLRDQTTTSVNALLGGYLETHGAEEEDPMIFFNRVRLSGGKPDSSTFSQLVSLSSEEASLVKGKCLHANVIKTGFENSTSVGNSLITMYAKCGSIKDSALQFNCMVEHDRVTWNAIISACALHGQGREALGAFRNMEREGFVPDEITLLAALQACCYSGLYEEGWYLYNSMERRYGIKPGVEHQTCLIDLLGRAGYPAEALEFIEKSPYSDSPLLWRTLLNGCKLNRASGFGRIASRKLLELASDDAGSCILVSNLYASEGMFEVSNRVRVKMNEENVRKDAGCSWIEINNTRHRFVASSSDHPESVEIYTELNALSKQMKENMSYVSGVEIQQHEL